MIVSPSRVGWPFPFHRLLFILLLAPGVAISIKAVGAAGSVRLLVIPGCASGWCSSHFESYVLLARA